MKQTMRHARARSGSPRRAPPLVRAVQPGRVPDATRPSSPSQRRPKRRPKRRPRRPPWPWLFGPPAQPVPYVFLPEPQPEPLPPEPWPPDDVEPSPGSGGEPALDDALFEPEPEPVAEFESLPPTLRRGSRGSSVVDLQQRLAAAGYDPGAADGIFGARTENAVRNYQRAEGLVIDGVVGPVTWERLLGDTDVAWPPVTPPPVTPVPGVDWSRVGADQRMRHAMDVLVNRYGYPRNGAAGIVGNLYAESQVIPNRIEGSSSLTPMRAPNFSGVMTNFTPEQIMNRSSRSGPKYPGVGLAQWTSPNRRIGLFRHSYGGRVLGAAILFDMDAQLDYLVHELRTSYASVNAVVTRPNVSVDDASDEVVYRFEIPQKVLNRPRHDPQVQAVFAERRTHSQRALRAFLAG